MEKKLTQQESVNLISDDNIQQLDSAMTFNFDTFSHLQISTDKNTKFDINGLGVSNFLTSGCVFQDPNQLFINPKIISAQNHFDNGVFQIGSTGYSAADSIVPVGSNVPKNTWILSNNNYIDNGVFQNRSIGNSASDRIGQMSSHVSINPWVVSNLNHFNNGVFNIGSTGYSAADSVVQVSSHVSKRPWAVSNLNHFNNGVFNFGSTGYSAADSFVQMSSQVSKSHWVVSNLNHFDNGVFQIGSVGYSDEDSVVRVRSHVSKRPWVDSIQNRYDNEVFQIGSTKYPNAGSVVWASSNHFESLWINPNLYRSEYGVFQVTKTEFPWLDSKLSTWQTPVASFSNYSSNALNITRSSIIEYDDNGLLTPKHPFRVYEPLDNYTLNILKSTLESTIQKFKNHYPIQRYSLGFEKGEQITVINIFIVQGDVNGDNHHFGDKIYGSTLKLVKYMFYSNLKYKWINIQEGLLGWNSSLYKIELTGVQPCIVRSPLNSW